MEYLFCWCCYSVKAFLTVLGHLKQQIEQFEGFAVVADEIQKGRIMK